MQHDATGVSLVDAGGRRTSPHPCGGATRVPVRAAAASASRGSRPTAVRPLLRVITHGRVVGDVDFRETLTARGVRQVFVVIDARVGRHDVGTVAIEIGLEAGYTGHFALVPPLAPAAEENGDRGVTPPHIHFVDLTLPNQAD